MTTYALSAYLAPLGYDGMTFNRHDHAIALWSIETDRIELARYWQLERISGQKHHDWPILAADDVERLVSALLADEGLELGEVKWAWGVPCRDDEGMLQSYADTMNVSSHAIAHLFSALLLDSTLMRSGTVVALAVDGGPDYVGQSRVPENYYAGAVARLGAIDVFPVESAGQIYEAVSQFYGMEPGTLMAAAGMCTCSVDIPGEEILKERRFSDRRGQIVVAPKMIEEVDARCRDAFRARTAWRCADPRPTPHEHFLSAVMKHVQQASTAVAVRTVRAIVGSHGVDPRQAHLAIGGGFALNCPTNSALLDEFGFRSIRIPPTADDSGQALGIGLAELYLHGLFDERDHVFETPYLGPVDIGTDLPADVANRYVATDFEIERFVEDVCRGPVAWVDGRSEMGPRALGHRSLLADPRRSAHRDSLNRIKERQWWRPVAPIVIEDRASHWFDHGHRSPYMLETWRVRSDKLEVVPAIAHLDGTARVQTLRRSDDPCLYAAVDGFARVTGVPILCNTSLNAKGEPIVETVGEAIRFCLNRGVEVLYVAGRRVLLGPAPAADPAPLHRSGEVFVRQEVVFRELWRLLAEQGITAEMLFMVSGRPEFEAMLFDTAGRRKLTELLPFVVRADPDNKERLARFIESRGPEARFGLHAMQRYVARPRGTQLQV